MNPIRAIDKLFYAVFGQTKNVDLMVVTPAENHPDWTKSLFKIVFGSYMLVTVVVLVKLLIATMSDTYQQIQAQSDTEWKFGLSKLIRSIHRATTTPSPINLISIWFFYLKDLFVERVINRQWRRLSPRTKAGSKWLTKLKRKTSTVSKHLKDSFGTPTTYAIQEKSIEHVVEWREITKNYRVFVKVKKKEKAAETKKNNKIEQNKPHRKK